MNRYQIAFYVMSCVSVIQTIMIISMARTINNMAEAAQDIMNILSISRDDVPTECDCDECKCGKDK
jgi:hypothetical protein